MTVKSEQLSSVNRGAGVNYHETMVVAVVVGRRKCKAGMVFWCPEHIWGGDHTVYCRVARQQHTLKCCTLLNFGMPITLS